MTNTLAAYGFALAYISYFAFVMYRLYQTAKDDDYEDKLLPPDRER